MKKVTATIKKKAKKSGSKEGKGGESSSPLIDWRGEMLDRIRTLIKQADPEVVEERKWRKPSNSMAGVPVWSHAGIICTGETYKGVVKLTFAKGASLADPTGLFNSSLEGNTRRAIDFHEGDKIDEKALKALIRAAAALNTSEQAAARPARSEETQERLREVKYARTRDGCGLAARVRPRDPLAGAARLGACAGRGRRGRANAGG